MPSILRAFTSTSGSISSAIYQFNSARSRPLRGFCSTAPKYRPYLVWAPDNTDDGAISRRMAVRPSHFVTANKLIKQGILRVAVMLCEADSIEDVRKLVEQDLYWTENVWDKEKLIILPMLMATTLPDEVGITQPTPED